MKIQANTPGTGLARPFRDDPEALWWERILWAKRIMLIVVGAGIGALAGVVVRSLGAGNWALFGGALLGAVLPSPVFGRSFTAHALRGCNPRR